MLNPFELVEPATLEEAAAELARLGDAAKVYAGGVELLLLLRNQLVEADYLVNVKRIPGLNAIRWDGQAVHIGATVTHRRMEWDELLKERLPLLCEAEKHIGNIRVRAQGTLGGNLCFADPHADPATALLVHDADVVVAHGAERRQLPLQDFLVGSYTVALEPDELLAEVVVAPLAGEWRTSYQRVEQYYRPTLNVAAAITTAGGKLSAARLAVGCIGPKAVRLHDLEVQLQGGDVAEARSIIQERSSYLEEVLEPVGDLLGSAEYKLYITKTLLGRAIEQAANNEGALSA